MCTGYIPQICNISVCNRGKLYVLTILCRNEHKNNILKDFELIEMADTFTTSIS